MAVRISRIRQQNNTGLREELRKSIVAVMILTFEDEKPPLSKETIAKERGM